MLRAGVFLRRIAGGAGMPREVEKTLALEETVTVDGAGCSDTRNGNLYLVIYGP